MAKIRGYANRPVPSVGAVISRSGADSRPGQSLVVVKAGTQVPIDSHPKSKNKPWNQDETLLHEGRYGEWFWQGMSDWATKYIKGEAVDRDNKTRICDMCHEPKYLADYTLTTRKEGHLECNSCVLNKQKTQGEPRRFEDKLPRNWAEQGSCNGADPAIFFPEGQGAYKKPDAKWRQFCPGCPVAELCEQFAVNSKSVGVFGGKFFTFKGNAVISVDVAMAQGRGRPKKAT